MPLPRLYRHAWMDDDVAAFREQVRRYVEGELAPHMEAWRRAGQIAAAVFENTNATLELVAIERGRNSF